MKDLAKSMARFSWAMSMFGAHQLAQVVSEDADNETGSESNGTARTSERLRSALDDVSAATVEDFDERFHSLFEAGTRMQEEMIDMACESMNPKAMIKTTTRLVNRAADAVKDLVPDDEVTASESSTTESSPPDSSTH